MWIHLNVSVSYGQLGAVDVSSKLVILRWMGLKTNSVLLHVWKNQLENPTSFRVRFWNVPLKDVPIATALLIQQWLTSTNTVKYFNIPVIFGKGPWAQVLRTSHVQHLPLFFRYANTTFSCQERWEMCYYAAFYCTNEKQNHSYVAVLASCRQDQTPTLIITSKTQGYQSHAVLVKTWWNEVCSSLNFWHRWQCSHFTEFHFLVPDHLLLWALLVRVHLYS